MGNRGKKWITVAVVSLLVLLAAELVLSIRKQTQTFDESAHLYAGYSYWKRADYGVNPEHPPLVKLLAALPLLPLKLPVQPQPEIYFRAASAVGGIQFLYAHDADSLLFRARMSVAVLTLCLALLVFLAGNEMFGAGAGLIGLMLFVFEPNILANGALVTTDVAAACLLFAAAYEFYRYAKKPSVARLLVCALASGLALAAKHSAVLMLPIFLALAATEIARRRAPAPATAETRGRQTLRLLGFLAVVTAISLTILWSFYGFRYQARPGSLQMTPPTAAFLKSLDYPVEAGTIGFLEQRHWLPEAYLYGLTDIVMLSRQGRPAFVLGHLDPAGRWFYFPVAFLIKTTLGLMLLLALGVAARRIWRSEYRRELLFLAVPAAIWFGVAMTSKLDIGVWHILPVYPFLIVLAGGIAWMLVRQSRRWVYAVALLLAFQAVSSLRAFPHYLPYSNEAWGGPSKTYKLLADSNVGWQSGLTGLKSYLDSRGITQCWFAYDGPVNPNYYRIPCKPLPTLFSVLTGRPQGVVPEQIQGPVFLGSAELTGFDFGPEHLNPYNQFVNLPPTAVLEGEILRFDGTFHVTQISALSHFAVGNALLGGDHPDQAFRELKTAAQLDPNFRWTHQALEGLYVKMKQPEDARREFQLETRIYRTVLPDFQRLNPPPQDPLGH
jgi:hypothetical protein